MKYWFAEQPLYSFPLVAVASNGSSCTIGTVEVILQTDRSVDDGKDECHYCKGRTFDDHMGNCAACGAPRER